MHRAHHLVLVLRGGRRIIALLETAARKAPRETMHRRQAHLTEVKVATLNAVMHRTRGRASGPTERLAAIAEPLARECSVQDARVSL